MLKIRFVFILFIFFFILISKAGLVYASNQTIQILPPTEGLTFNFPLVIHEFLLSSNSFFNFLPSRPNQIIKNQPSPTSTTIISSSTEDAPRPTAPDEPTPIDTPTSTPTPTPTRTPAPIITNTPTSTPTPTPHILIPYTSPKGSLSADKIFDLVNIHRKAIGLPQVQKNDRVCEVAQARAPELAAEFSSGNLHQGIRARHLPYWNHENIISTTSEQAAVDGWLSDDIHRKGIEGDYKYSCVACSGNKCVQEFTNLVSK